MNCKTNRRVLFSMAGMVSFALGSLLALFLTSPDTIVSAQGSSGCPTLSTSNYGWERFSTVIYDVDQIPENIRPQIRTAFQKWDNARGSTCTVVSFREKQPGEDADYIFKKEQVFGSPALTGLSVGQESHYVREATTSLDIDNTQYFNPNQPGYETVFMKAALHEIGHTMGLGHPSGGVALKWQAQPL